MKHYLPRGKIFRRITAWGFKTHFRINLTILEEKSFYGKQKKQSSLFGQKNINSKGKCINLTEEHVGEYVCELEWREVS